MNARKALLHVWAVGLLPPLLYLAIAAALGWWLGWIFGAFIALFAIWSWIEWWGQVKRDVLRGLPETLNYLPTNADDFPALDRGKLDELTQELEAVGFAHLRDTQLDPEAGGTVPGLARLLGHPQQQCYGELFQVFPPDRDPLPLVYSIISYLDDSWILATTTSPPDSTAHMWRDRKTCWSYHPQTPPGDLFSIHLARRQQMMEDLGLQVQPEISWPYYEQQQQLSALRRRRNLQKRNIAIALFEATWVEFNPASEWWGDYGKQLKVKS